MPSPTRPAPFSLLSIDVGVQVGETRIEHINRSYLLALRVVETGKEASLSSAVRVAFSQSSRLRAGSAKMIFALRDFDTPLGRARVFSVQAFVSEAWREEMAGPMPPTPDAKSERAWKETLHERCLLEWGRAALDIELASLRGQGILAEPLFFELEDPAAVGDSERKTQNEMAARYCAIVEKAKLGETLGDAGAAGSDGARKALSL
jgi:hypothetical protein